MKDIIRLDLVKDEQFKKGLEKIDDALGYFLGIEHLGEKQKLMCKMLYAAIKTGELLCTTENVEHQNVEPITNKFQ